MPLSKTMISRKALYRMQNELQELKQFREEQKQQQQQHQRPRQQRYQKQQQRCAAPRYEALDGTSHYAKQNGRVQHNAIEINVPSSRFGGGRNRRRQYR